ENYCLSAGLAFTRFDYFGHGESSGAFKDGSIGRWADDAVRVLDEIATGPQILVGSSMGGWIMLLVALRRPARIAGLLGIAAAPDFTEDLIPPALSKQQRLDLQGKGFCEIPNCYDDQEPYLIRATLLTEGRNHILLRGEIAIEAPVRLIHGMQDPDVPWQTALKLAERLRATDVEVQLVKDGEHRLSRPTDLERLTRTLDGLIATINGRD
ncbi:MAG: alpha/beta hydrolase, partial [Proteobacteria bacterium]|nr:alpha/beta hydrolase [Pseudomonadota bacterium]